MSTQGLGSNDSSTCCYTSFPPRDKSLTSLNACNAEISHQRSLCLATVDLVSDTIRANTIIANEIIVQQILRPPTTAGIFGTVGTAEVINVPAGIAQYDLAVFGFVLTAAPNNIGVSLNATADQVIVDRDGWYQISIALSQVSQGAGASDAVWGITINGITFYPVDTVVAATTSTVRGTIGVRLMSGDVVGIGVQTTAPSTIGGIGGITPSAMTVARVGA